MQAKVVRIIDGDIFVLSDSQRVRLLGIGTPELNSSDSFYVSYARNLIDSLINNQIIKLVNGICFIGNSINFIA